MLINRAAMILKPTQEAVDWINSADPVVGSDPIQLAEVQDECLVYLLPEEVESDVHAMSWALQNAEILLEEFMHIWYQDEDLWPKNYGPKLFQKWFKLEYHSMVIDTLNEPILKEEM